MTRLLIDECCEGLDVKLYPYYEAYSVRKLQEMGYKVKSDYSVIRFAVENNLLLLSHDNEVIAACEENDIPHVRVGHQAPLTSILENISKAENKYQRLNLRIMEKPRILTA